MNIFKVIHNDYVIIVVIIFIVKQHDSIFQIWKHLVSENLKKKSKKGNPGTV